MTETTPPTRLQDDRAAIEEAMYQLAYTSKQRTLHKPSYTEPSVLTERSAIEWLIADPIAHSCLQGWLVLLQHLKTLVGEAEAIELNDRVNARVFEELERPAIAAGQVQ